MAALLVHDEQTPASARAALRSVPGAVPSDRVELLEAAARSLHRDGGVSCADAMELVDLGSSGCDAPR